MTFDASIVSAVTAHMNTDHPEDNLLIARAFGRPDVTEATMTGLDEQGGVWSVRHPGGRDELSVPWPGGPVAERPEIRRAVVLLYRAACTRLGVPARVEHGSAPGRPSAHPGGGEPRAEPGFAARLREATRTDHGRSEGTGFMADLLGGRGTMDDYADLVVQHWHLYAALDEAAAALAAHPVLAGLHPEGLGRRDALERDLVRLRGERWRERSAAVPATQAYAARIREVAAQGWTAGILAHHYTRYLGDLSGGQHIARRVSAQFGFDDDGAEFYDFAGIGDARAFVGRYRAGLDAFAADLDAGERERMQDEVHRAYRFNTAVFEELAAAGG